MDDPLVVRGLERLGDLPGDVERVGNPIAPRVSRSASVGPSTSSMTSAMTPAAVLDSVDRARCGDD